MSVDPKLVVKLRQQTGAGMNDAKEALQAADGDMDKATEVLRQKGQAKADKKAGRETKAGLVDSYIHMGRIGAMVEVNCETDFVARTDEFKDFTHNIAMHVAAAHPDYVHRDEVPERLVEAEKKIIQEQEGTKPQDVLDKIMTGKLEKFYAAVCLLEQPYVKDEDKTVEEYLKEVVGQLGENIVIARFARLELGGSDE